MTRDYAAIRMGIWADADWRGLPPEAQHLYLMLWTHPKLSYCGVMEWRPGRLTNFAGGWTRDAIERAAACLEARHFVVVDRDAEEVLIRSWIRFDGLMGQPIMAVSMTKAHAAVSSNLIRGVIVHELLKLREAQPELGGWKKAAVVDLLGQPSIDPKTRNMPADPWANPAANPPPNPPAKGYGLPSPNPPSTPTPTPTPTPKRSLVEEAKRATSLPSSWEPNAKHHEYAKANGIDLAHEVEQFRNYHLAKGTTFKSWDAAFRTWLGNAKKWAPPSSAARPAALLNPPRPPDDMPDHLFRAWNQAHADAHAAGTKPPSDWRELREAS